ncbi:hypothetical protein HOP50_17g79440 [Chloropicon primus]|uniref:Uncharacterized protein n=2 Tax=Chloropicon primus TaxID=1764295 RepID=A0A5B8N0H7_9CHLO|nr:hypothetical protein A3770_17p79230 [Chloropicon primus]UPR04602.1 hypothetical protein HOP50_17g79440 [Chloropicon primus]|eukprot:QDZ25405.1 hypothetical protein A3770_17p79230 [Chloropicon primus]
MAARNKRDVVGRILNYDLPPSPPPRPSMRMEPLVDAQAAGVGRARYGIPPQPPAYARENNPKPEYPYRNNPVLQPLSNNQLNQQENQRRQVEERDRLREAYRALQQRPQSPRNVLEPLPASTSSAQQVRAQTNERLEFLQNQISLSMNRVGTRVDSVEEVIASLGRVVVQCQKDIQVLSQDKRQLEMELRDSRQMLEQEQATRAESNKDYLRLGYKIDSLSSEIGAQKIEMQTFKSQLLGDSALLEKLREATGDTVQVTAEQIATLNKRVGDVMRNVQLLTQSFADEVKERKALEQESRIQYTNAEASLVQTESNILRRVLSVVEAQSKEILRKVGDGESLAEERHAVHRSALEEQWKMILNKEALEKKTIIERMLVLEKALREEHESRTYSERMIKDFVEQKNEEVGKAFEVSRADVRDNIDYLRKQLVGTFQRMEGLVTETDQATGAKVKELESIVKLEVQARMKAIRKLNAIWQDSFSEVNKIDSRMLNLESTVQEIENSVTDIVVGEVTDNLLEASVQELHFEDMERRVTDMGDKVIKTKEMLLQEFDSMKDLQEVAKRRQDTAIEQMRSEMNLKQTTAALRFDELKAQVEELKAIDPTKDMKAHIEEIEKQKVKLAEMEKAMDECNDRTRASVQNVEDIDDKVEGASNKILELRTKLLAEFDALKDLQEVSKRRQDNAIDQVRSEHTLNKVNAQLKMEEFKSKLHEISLRIDSLSNGDPFYGPEPEEGQEVEEKEVEEKEVVKADIEEVEGSQDSDEETDAETEEGNVTEGEEPPLPKQEEEGQEAAEVTEAEEGEGEPESPPEGDPEENSPPLEPEPKQQEDEQ